MLLFLKMTAKILFLILFFVSPHLQADIWQGHVKPTLQHGFDQRGFIVIGAGSFATFAAQPTYDEQMKETWGHNQKIPEDQSRVGDLLGTGVPGVTIAVTQLFVDKENGAAHSEALVWSFATTSVLKLGNQRQRPNGLNRHSMPSGHTSTIFTTATSLAYAYGWKVAVPAYVLATFVALTRVSDDAHWLSDTIAGATIGIFWGRAASDHHQITSTSALEPWFIDDGLGVKWVKRF